MAPALEPRRQSRGSAELDPLAWVLTKALSRLTSEIRRASGSGISLMDRHHWIRAGTLFVLTAVWTARAGSQAHLRTITQPIPVVNSGGHSAPVRALIFPGDGTTLLSGGMDKVVNVWKLGDPRPRLVQTIRPRIWRGYAGSIYAMALSPAADARGQRLLAVAGIGVETNRGEINLFRFPGLLHRPTGEVDAQLPGGSAPWGHGMSVMCLAFDPTGQFLASGSNDASVRIWRANPDHDHRVDRAPRPGQRPGLLARRPPARDRRADGLVQLWDVARGAVIATARPNPAGNGGTILPATPSTPWRSAPEEPGS